MKNKSMCYSCGECGFFYLGKKKFCECGISCKKDEFCNIEKIKYSFMKGGEKDGEK